MLRAKDLLIAVPGLSLSEVVYSLSLCFPKPNQLQMWRVSFLKSAVLLQRSKPKPAITPVATRQSYCNPHNSHGTDNDFLSVNTLYHQATISLLNNDNILWDTLLNVSSKFKQQNSSADDSVVASKFQQSRFNPDFQSCSLWSTHILSVSAWVCSRCSSFLQHLKDAPVD